MRKLVMTGGQLCEIEILRSRHAAIFGVGRWAISVMLIWEIGVVQKIGPSSHRHGNNTSFITSSTVRIVGGPEGGLSFA
jgi:type IV secretory pathway TrbD component